jgi:hypothetical protein
LSVTCDRSVVFFGYSAISSTNKTDRHDITVILLKMALNTITLTLAKENYTVTVNHYWKWPKWLVGLCYLTPLSTLFLLSLRSVLLMEETGIPEENHEPVASYWQMLYRVHLAMNGVRTHNFSVDRHNHDGSVTKV